MGYVARNLSSTTVADVLGQKQMIFAGMMAKPSIGTTEEDMYKVTIDFDNIDYLMVVAHAQGSGATVGTLKVKIAGVTKATIVEGAAEDYANSCTFNEIDCTAITGDNVLSVTGDNDNAGGYTTAYPIYIFARES